METIKELLEIYCKVTCMVINMNKFKFLINGLDEAVDRKVESLFPIKLDDLNQGVKYPRFHSNQTYTALEIRPNYTKNQKLEYFSSAINSYLVEEY